MIIKAQFSLGSYFNKDSTMQLQLFFLVALALTSRLDSGYCKESEDGDELVDVPNLGRVIMDNDFEGHTYYPWIEESPGTLKWKVENYTNPWESGSPIPKPRKGLNVLRAVRDSSLNAGMAVIRSPLFSVSPGDRVSFSFWLRSNVTAGTNLELYWVQNSRENLLGKLDQYSNSSNFVWQTKEYSIPVASTSQIQLVFYAFLGSRSGDAVAIDNIAINATIAQPSGCNKILTSTSGTFTSPNYPANYPDNTYCSWIIVTDASLRATITFSSIKTENNTDLIRVHDGPTEWAPILGSFSGQLSVMPSPIKANTDMILVTFESDGSLSSTGFSASYTTSPAVITTTKPTQAPPLPCGSQYVGSGYIQSPNYPDYYPPLIDCYYKLQGSAANYISLQFSDFSLQNVYDWVTVYEGWTTTGATLLYRYSGKAPPRSVESTTTNKMMVYFHTSNYSTIFSTGFRAYYSSDRLPTPAPTLPSPVDCTAVLSGTGGTFETPNYPGFYDNNLRCKWTITVAWPYRVQVTFSSIYTADSGDVLTVYDGSSTSSPIIAQTGGAAMPISTRSTGQACVVTFNTNASGTTSGWHASYQII